MRIITNRYRKETGKSAYNFNWFGKRLHNQDYIDWLEKQCIINSVTQHRELLIAFSEYVVKNVARKGHEEVVDCFLKNHKAINSG